MLKTITKSLAGRKNHKRRASTKRSLRLESLERRELMAADILGLVDPGVAESPVETAPAVEELAESRGSVTCKRVWTSEGWKYMIYGTNSGDNVEIYGEWDDFAHKNVLKIKANGVVISTITNIDFKEIVFVGAGGADNLVVQQSAQSLLSGEAHIKFDGGAGDDTFTNNTNITSEAYGGKGVDTLKGGSGTDHLHGGEGDDYIYGGKGCDYINGNDGNDSLYHNDKYNNEDYAPDEIYGGDKNGSDPNDLHDKAWIGSHDYGQDIDHFPWRSHNSAPDQLNTQDPVEGQTDSGETGDEMTGQTAIHRMVGGKEQLGSSSMPTDVESSADAYFTSLGVEDEGPADERMPLEPSPEARDALFV